MRTHLAALHVEVTPYDFSSRGALAIPLPEGSYQVAIHSPGVTSTVVDGTLRLQASDKQTNLRAVLRERGRVMVALTEPGRSNSDRLRVLVRAPKETDQPEPESSEGDYES